jgi:hypothetical protein
LKKLAIIGRGTAGCFAAMHFLRYTEWDIDFYFDPNIKPQTVGEGISLVPTISLRDCLGFKHSDLKHVDGVFKTGIVKSGWNSGTDFEHTFPPSNVAYHFNAVKLQDYIISKIQNSSRFKLIEKNTNANDIDSTFVMDCSGKPNNFEDFNTEISIPVNAVHVTQCYWDHPKFQHTLTIARPYGWVFGIPLQNRCSIGYMYNHTISTLEEVKEDVKNIFVGYNLTPSVDHNTFQFSNYYRKENHQGRISYNGNASFFLEPLEATSITTMLNICRQAFDVWHDNLSKEASNNLYIQNLTDIENIIMLHYLADSQFKSKFWDFAQERAYKNIESLLMSESSSRFLSIYEESKSFDWKINSEKICESAEFGTWGIHSMTENLNSDALNLYDKIDKMVFSRNFENANK